MLQDQKSRSFNFSSNLIVHYFYYDINFNVILIIVTYYASYVKKNPMIINYTLYIYIYIYIYIYMYIDVYIYIYI